MRDYSTQRILCNYCTAILPHDSSTSVQLLYSFTLASRSISSLHFFCPFSLIQSFVLLTSPTFQSYLKGCSSKHAASLRTYLLPPSLPPPTLPHLHILTVTHVILNFNMTSVLCRCGIALDLSIDRKASDPEEIARIAESGV